MRQAWVALDMEEDAPIDIVFGDNALGGLEDIIGETSGIESLIGTDLEMKVSSCFCLTSWSMLLGR